MEKYINVTDLSDKIKKLSNDDWYLEGLVGTDELYELVRTLPAADVVEVKHAYWEDHGSDNPPTCSNCGSRALLNYESDYFKSSNCPHCGAKMDKRGVKND